MTAARDALKLRLRSAAANRIPPAELLVLKLVATSVMAGIDASRAEREANIRPVQKHVPPPPPGMHLPDKGARHSSGWGRPVKTFTSSPAPKAKKKSLSETDRELFGERPWWDA